MVDLFRSPIPDEGKEDVNDQSSQEFKKQANPISHPLTEPEVSFADSLLDFDFIGDWIGEVPESYDFMASDDLRENPVGISGENAEFNVLQKSIELGFDEFREKSRVEESSLGEEDGKLELVAHDVVETGVGGSDNVPVGDMICEIHTADLGLLIEKEMEKVSLGGVSNGSVSTVDVVNAITSGGGISGDVNGMNTGATENRNGDGMAEKNEVANAFGNSLESGGGGTASGEAGKIVELDGNQVKSPERRGDQDKNECNSEANETESSSSSSSSSSSDDESSNDDEEDEEDNEDVGEQKIKRGSLIHGERGGQSKKGEVEREMDIEEGEIMVSDAEGMVAWSGDEYDEDDGVAAEGPIRSKNELMDLPPVPPVEVTLQLHHLTLPVGAVLSILGSRLIVEGVEKHNPLNEGSILWITESRSPLGIVDEIFGPVKNPYYIVRYNSESEVPTGIKPGTSISFVPEFVNFVLNDKSIYQKGYDASGANDEEVLHEEFSDDEKEAEHRKMLKLKKRGTSDEKIDNRTKGKRKSKNRPGNGNICQTTQMQASLRQAKPPVDNSNSNPCMAPLLNYGCGLSSSGLGQGLAVLPGTASPAAQFGMGPTFNTSPIGAQGFPFQQPQSMGPPGLPTSTMPWVQQFHSQPQYQMPLQNGVAFQQQMDTSSSFPPVASGLQSGFTAATAFTPWPACFTPNMFQSPPFGMGALGQQAPFPINVGEQAFPLNTSMGAYNFSSQPDDSTSGNQNSSPSYGCVRNSGRGRNTHGRRGGRFGRGRGRQQTG